MKTTCVLSQIKTASGLCFPLCFALCCVLQYTLYISVSGILSNAVI